METRTRLSQRLAALGQSRVVFALASLPLLVPCFWQSRVQAGDLSSHLYNAWLAQLVEGGRAPGLVVVWQSTNVLFDWLLGALFRGLGPAAAERIAVALAVLVFTWGAFAFLSVVAGRRVWELLPCVAMLAYGWVFHIGFFNFYLGLGLCFWALAVSWSGTLRGVGVAAPILALAWVAHALPVVWVVALLVYSWVWRRLPPRVRPFAPLGAIVLLALSSAVFARIFASRWTPNQAALATGADQLRVFDAKYDALAWALLAVWGFLLVSAIRSQGLRSVCSRLELQVWLICAAGAVIVPGVVRLPGYGHALVFITERMSLAAAVMACAVVASPHPRRASLAFAGIAAAFFAFLYHDERILNQFEDRLDEIVERLPPEQRVILAVRDPTLRINALTHTIDRACIGRCYSFANYEPSTLQFRVRVEAPNPIVASTYADSSAMQVGGYVVLSRDQPLYQVGIGPDGWLGVEALAAGQETGMTLIGVLPDIF